MRGKNSFPHVYHKSRIILSVFNLVVSTRWHTLLQNQNYRERWIFQVGFRSNIILWALLPQITFFWVLTHFVFSSNTDRSTKPNPWKFEWLGKTSTLIVYATCPTHGRYQLPLQLFRDYSSVSSEQNKIYSISPNGMRTEIFGEELLSITETNRLPLLICWAFASKIWFCWNSLVKCNEMAVI